MFSPFSLLVAFSLNQSMDLLSIEKNIAIADVAKKILLNLKRLFNKKNGGLKVLLNVNKIVS